MQATAPPVLTSKKANDNAAFVKEFQGAALRWAMHAAIAGAMLFAVFLVVARFGERASDSAQLIRLFFVVYFLALSALLWKGRLVSESNYVLVATVTSVISLVGTIAILRVQFDGPDSEAVLRSTPAVICGLFMMYTFLRLPVTVSLGIGACVSAVAVLWAPVVSGGAETIRSAVYLIFTNFLGALIALLIEERERELFFQRRRAEEAQFVASQRTHAAEEASREKTRLVAAISHDLRQPMLAAVTHLDVLRRKLERGAVAKAAEQAERAQTSVSILGSTLDQLLAAARYDSGQELLRIEEVGLAKILSEALELTVSEAERRGISIRVRVPPRYVGLITDSRSIRRILDNLLSNAVKFSTVDSASVRDAVLLAARVRGGFCEIDVFDRGPGIPAAKLEEIWKPYVRLGAVERDRARGLGLGLFLVKTIIDQLPGHSVRVASREGIGSRFTIKLPVSDNSSPPPDTRIKRTEDVCVPAVDLSGVVIGVVEDDRDARVAITDLLEDYGAVVYASSLVDEVAAAVALMDCRVDAIVCDYSLSSGVKGTEAIRELRVKLGYSPNAILVTGDSEVDALRAQVGDDVYIFKKPFSPALLLSILARAARGSRFGDGSDSIDVELSHD